MDFQLKRLLPPLVLLLCSTNAWTLIDTCQDTYFGIDAQSRHITWSPQNGNVFKKNFFQGNIYAGLKIDNNIGIELGYETAFHRRTSVTLNAGDVFLSQTVLEEDAPPLFVNAKTQIMGFHGDLIAYYPLWCDKLELIGSVGLVNLKLKNKIIFLFADGTMVPESLRTFNKQRVAPRLGLGLRQKITECLGLRFMVNWERLSSFQNISPYASESPTSPLRVGAKHSFIYSLGFFINF